MLEGRRQTTKVREKDNGTIWGGPLCRHSLRFSVRSRRVDIFIDASLHSDIMFSLIKKERERDREGRERKKERDG